MFRIISPSQSCGLVSLPFSTQVLLKSMQLANNRAIFTVRRSSAIAVLGIVILFVRPSIHLSHACFVTKQKTYCRCFDITWRSNHSSFLTPTEVVG